MSNSLDSISEAQELIEAFSSRLIEVEGQLRDGDELDPALVDAAFRSIHTLKAGARLLDAAKLETLSHEIETVLNELRLGRLGVDEGSLGLLFESTDLFEALLRGVIDPAAPSVDIEPFLARLKLFAQGPAPVAEPGDPLAWLDDSIRAVLTEFEEFRLRENVRLGRRICRVSSSFDLMAVDVGISALKDELQRFGEVITCLPNTESTSDDHIGLDFVLGSARPLADIAAGIQEREAKVEALQPLGDETVREPAAARPSAPAPAPAPAPPAQPTTPAPTESPAPSPEQAKREQLSVKSLSQTVRVDLGRLDHLMKLVGELSLVHTNLDAGLERMLPAQLSTDLRREFRDQLRVMNRRLGLLQEAVLEVRMVPLGHVFGELERLAHKVARKLGKEVRLDISGEDTELDKVIVDSLSRSMIHMINNAIDHGIETPEARLAKGKPRAGRVSLAAHQRGNRVIIELSDDGRGMDWQGIRERAVQRGFITRDEADALSPAQALNLIFTAGFSTRNSATTTAGWGVGMDAVKTNIAKHAGMIDVSSELGVGSRLRVTLPTTLAIIQALVIEAAGQTFCIPLNSVLESIMIQPREVQTIEGAEVVSVRGRTLPLLHLARVFELEPTVRKRQRDHHEHLYVVVVGLAEHRIGLVVDELRGQQDVVSKPVGKALARVPGISGATELGDNRTVLLLDVGTLVAEAVGGAAISL
ncbi:Signal transduction histidine kinase CheA [Enhygromyxa salina]|uniref:histidine kinase n=1 Tax=Enhygromyxa salina TaxID=215803 RepID=A0A0C2DAR1_9BACT|nr:chemotaxis protein CheA [Enhygromyxa salina]KIG16977.1 Signal transduction histidine kinase CheA [Enhygromyxa salina]